jgi:uncharacterized protein YraI
MKSLNVLCSLVAALAAWPVASHAQQIGYAAKDIHLRAGPSRDYPVVAVIGQGVSFIVEGCVADYRWCDVMMGPDRGWVYAGNIIYSYAGESVPLLSYGPLLGIGIITFSVGDYWGSYYRNRPWYSQRHHWMNRPQPVFRPHPGVRPGHLPGQPVPIGPGGMPGAAQNPVQTRPPAGDQHPLHRVRPPDATQHNQPPDANQHTPRVRPPAAGEPTVGTRRPADAAPRAVPGPQQHGPRRARTWEEESGKARK